MLLSTAGFYTMRWFFADVIVFWLLILAWLYLPELYYFIVIGLPTEEYCCRLMASWIELWVASVRRRWLWADFAMLGSPGLDEFVTRGLDSFYELIWNSRDASEEFIFMYKFIIFRSRTTFLSFSLDSVLFLALLSMILLIFMRDRTDPWLIFYTEF